MTNEFPGFPSIISANMHQVEILAQQKRIFLDMRPTDKNYLKQKRVVENMERTLSRGLEQEEAMRTKIAEYNKRENNS